MGKKIRNIAGDDWNKYAGTFHKSTVDPAGIQGDPENSDPLHLFDYSKPPAAVAAPSVMPDADSEAVAAARRRKVAQGKNRGGRQSTIDTPFLGGDPRLGG